ncbi:hypothetical protein C8T65DRAFT_833725, partial [Cerioporus squamosus]
QTSVAQKLGIHALKTSDIALGAPEEPATYSRARGKTTAEARRFPSADTCGAELVATSVSGR